MTINEYYKLSKEQKKNNTEKIIVNSLTEAIELILDEDFNDETEIEIEDNSKEINAFRRKFKEYNDEEDYDEDDDYDDFD